MPIQTLTSSVMNPANRRPARAALAIQESVDAISNTNHHAQTLTCFSQRQSIPKTIGGEVKNCRIIYRKIIC